MYEHYDKLSNCLNIFYKWSSRGLITGQIKEKYETTRWYVTFGVWGLHGVFYPKHIYYRWPKWTWKINELSQTIMEITGIMFLLYKSTDYSVNSNIDMSITKYYGENCA